jgi:predicted dehydrogenase
VYKVKIYGAGSIGNHLAHACRAKGWDVFMYDIDPEALKRTQQDIYPSRYGRWDPGIQLSESESLSDGHFDLVIIGTPPDTHVGLATRVLKDNPPKVLLVEKPLCAPSLEGVEEIVRLQKATGSFVAVGYNHTLTENSRRASQILARNTIGDPITISARFREHWGGIFAAHPWLRGPEDTYLGFFERGGGASGEHSHAINIWQHLAHLVGAGRIVEVSATMDMVADGGVRYDRICLVSVKTQTGLIGNIVQDVVTEPAQKAARVQGSNGFLEWVVNSDEDHDALRYWDGKSAVTEETIRKSRPDDFKGEIDHLEDILKGEGRAGSPISLQRGLDTMMVIAAAHVSRQHKKTVRINYEEGYRPDAIQIL